MFTGATSSRIQIVRASVVYCNALWYSDGSLCQEHKMQMRYKTFTTVDQQSLALHRKRCKRRK